MVKIFDNHVHVTPSSIDFFTSVFTKAGGTSINLVNLTEECLSLDDFRKKYEETISISRTLRERGLEVVVSIGPYPVNIIEMRRLLEREKVLELYRKAVDVAIKLIEEGKANAIGEVGRPHFDTSAEIIEDSNTIMEYIFQESADREIPVILHTESLDSRGMCEIMEMARRSGKYSKVVKHFSQPIFKENCNIIPSVPAGRKNSRSAPWGEKGFFLETDFAGDASKPNFVLPADSVPKRVAMLRQEGVEEDRLERSMSFYREFYGVE
ncbi:MAG: TatD family hydrolase [Candidatus Thermoplasmatota archaeon]|jgi:TatD-related deoxyribonuclease|nr:TatD family hydrolase [Candidatus Thermoplasmatota archaeon]